MVTQLLHGYYDRGFPVLELRYVARQYATTWLAFDLIVSFPYVRLARLSPDHVGSSSGGGSDSVSRAIELLSLMKCLRVIRLPRVLRKSFSKLLGGGTLVRVVLILLVWVMVAHFFACAWFAVGWYQNACVGGAFTSTWVSEYWPQLNLSLCAECASDQASGGANCSLPSPLPSPADESVVPFYEKYILSFYWALATMSSMGYGNGPTAGQVRWLGMRRPEAPPNNAPLRGAPY